MRDTFSVVFVLCESEIRNIYIVRSIFGSSHFGSSRTLRPAGVNISEGLLAQGGYILSGRAFPVGPYQPNNCRAAPRGNLPGPLASTSPVSRTTVCQAISGIAEDAGASTHGKRGSAANVETCIQISTSSSYRHKRYNYNNLVRSSRSTGIV